MRQGPFIITRTASKLKSKLFRMRKLITTVCFLQIILIVGIYTLYRNTGSCVFKYGKLISVIPMRGKSRGQNNEVQGKISAYFRKDINWNNITRREQTDDVFNDRWIVLTTINPPTEQVKRLAAIKGWKVVVVGDTKTPKNWRLVLSKIFNCSF